MGRIKLVENINLNVFLFDFIRNGNRYTKRDSFFNIFIDVDATTREVTHSDSVTLGVPLRVEHWIKEGYVVNF